MTPPAASAAAAPAIHPRRTTAPRRAPATKPRRPRRISGPANPARHPSTARSRNSARAQTHRWAGPAHAVGLAEAVATHRLLDRLIRGRIWIGVIAFALIGIVTMQLVLLKLNAGIGRSLVRETLLQRENATLSAENSEVAAGEQVEAQAERAGMEPIPSGAVRFLTAHPSTDVSKAAAALSAWSAGSGAATGTTTTGESSSGAEAGASTADASAETSSATMGAGTGTEPAGTGAATSTAAAQSTAETGSAVSTGATAGQISTSGTDAGSSTGEPDAGAAHPAEATASPGDSATGAGEASSQSTPTSTGGTTTSGG
jgi:hypothetical protein